MEAANADILTIYKSPHRTCALDFKRFSNTLVDTYISSKALTIRLFFYHSLYNLNQAVAYNSTKVLHKREKRLKKKKLTSSKRLTPTE